MNATRTNALTKVPNISGSAIPSDAGIPHLLFIPVHDSSLNNPDTMKPANTEEPDLSFSVCGRMLTRLLPHFETRRVAGHPGNTGIIIPEVA